MPAESGRTFNLLTARELERKLILRLENNVFQMS